MSRLATPIRKNDSVLVITGKDRGKRGRVLKVLPDKNRLIGRVSMIATVSPMPAVLFSSCTMNFDVRRMVLPYRPCRTCHSTATTMLFCILLLTTTPVFSDF